MTNVDKMLLAHGRMNRLCKWRRVFVWWQLGRSRFSGSQSTDAEANAIADHREVTMLLRAEVNALAALLVEKGIITTLEWTVKVGEEADALATVYQLKFPGIRATADGLDLNTSIAADTMQGWKP